MAENIGRYEVVGPWGGGRRLTARDPYLGRLVTIRRLDAPAGSGDRERLKAIAAVNDAHIEPILEFFWEGEATFVVSPFFSETTLKDLIARQDSISLEERLRIMQEIGKGLAALHDSHLVHQDLKSSNILIEDTREGQKIQIIDFGLGSPVEGPLIGPEFDLWSYGAVFYELMSGQELTRVEPIVPLNVAPPNIPADIAQIIGRLIAFDLNERYQTIAAALSDLERFFDRIRLVGGPITRFLPDADEPVWNPNVQFTVYRPKIVEPAKFYPFLGFMHLSERPADAPDEPDPIAEVERQAELILKSEREMYQPLTQDSSQAIPRTGQITFAPFAEGLEFEPKSKFFVWQDSVHRETFRFRALPETVGKTTYGRMTVFLGSIVVAEVRFSIGVAERVAEATSQPAERASSHPYRNIFACYSRDDVAIVEEVEKHARGLGDRYLRDLVTIRTGEVWNDRVQTMIDEADIFQLFWSTSSMQSEFVEREWRHALGLRRAHFVRPVFWETPLPEWPKRGLPPEELRALHFEQIYPAASVNVRFRDLSQGAGSRSEGAETALVASPPSALAAAPRVSPNWRELSDRRYSALPYKRLLLGRPMKLTREHDRTRFWIRLLTILAVALYLIYRFTR